MNFLFSYSDDIYFKPLNAFFVQKIWKCIQNSRFVYS